jgi:ketosteroid isomerase-like protein
MTRFPVERPGSVTTMTHEDVQRWLDAYIAAWRSNDADEIRALFGADAVYSYRPWDSEEHTVRGRDAIVASWLEDSDDPELWDAEYQPYVVEGNRAVAVGWSRYAASGDEPERLYHNAYLLEFDDEGRCSSFHEFYFLEGR